jgi:hypothetical protein
MSYSVQILLTEEIVPFAAISFRSRTLNPVKLSVVEYYFTLYERRKKIGKTPYFNLAVKIKRLELPAAIQFY